MPAQNIVYISLYNSIERISTGKKLITKDLTYIIIFFNSIVSTVKYFSLYILQDLIARHCPIIRTFRSLNHTYSYSESVFESMATKAEDEHTGFNEGLEKPKYVLY